MIGDPVAQQGRHELKILGPGEVVVGVGEPRRRVRASQRFRQLEDLARRHVLIVSALDDEGGRRDDLRRVVAAIAQAVLVERV